jgi:hypothetical protein
MHAHVVETFRRTRDQPTVFFMSPLPRSQFKPNGCLAKMYSDYRPKPSARECNPM